MLNISEYRSLVDLDHPRSITPDPDWEQSLRPVLAELDLTIADTASTAQMIDVLHGVLAPINPRVLDDRMVDRIEAIAAGIQALHRVVDARTIPTTAEETDTRYPAAGVVSVWLGDITRLGVAVIVNAANHEMLGCRIPNHSCIDNAIHSAAGPRLRDDCATIMKAQGTNEPVGAAKLTLAHALPSSYVAHTVGPQLTPGATPSPGERQQLAGCYRACLDTAAQIDSVETIGFCGISTGLFSFPARPAAEIALATIADRVDANPDRFERIVIDCFTAADAAIYRELLNGW